MSNLKQNERRLNTLTDYELKDKILLLKKELFNLRVQKSIGELLNTSRFLSAKKEIARIKTELVKRKLKD